MAVRRRLYRLLHPSSLYQGENRQQTLRELYRRRRRD